LSNSSINWGVHGRFWIEGQSLDTRIAAKSNDLIWDLRLESVVMGEGRLRLIGASAELSFRVSYEKVTIGGEA